MGIDLFEITFRIEKRFGVKIAGNEQMLAFCDTAGTLAEFVWQKLQGTEPAVPDLRKLHDEVWNGLKASARWKWWYGFSGRIERIIGGRDLQLAWSSLERALGVKLPELVSNPRDGSLHIPQDCETCVRLVHWISTNHAERVSYLCPARQTDRPANAERFTRHDCWREVQKILAETLCVELNDVVPEAHLINDLGME